MRKAKKHMSREKAYSYLEYVMTFYPKNLDIPKPFSEPESLEQHDPKVIGGRLALKSIEKAKRALQNGR